ncbi:MAG: hypothetical protein K9N49_10655, partial [Candidatus Marinimicrobia bacterium]|nr:hypothetical protein [Candidatus Neomarinimicrobiota bacterium]
THGLDLCGHPGQACDLGPGRWFQVPGQDLVWRWVLPDDPSALEGVESTQGKCSSSAAAHLGRRFNSNECFGAYGHEFNEREMLGLANWCFVRGVNRLYPHAFYYSIRGPRRHERPPDVGPHSPWWPRYQRFAEACRWLSWLITDATHVCQVAVLGLSDHLPWAAAKHLFQHQIDFNYLEARHLWEDACVSANGIRLRGFHYPVLIVESPPEPPPRIWESLAPLLAAGGVCAYRADAPGTRRVDDAPALLAALRNRITPDLTLEIPEPALRVRHMLKHDRHVWLLANESYRPLAVRAQPLRPGPFRLLNPWDRTDEPWDPATPIPIAPAASVVLVEAPPEYPYQSVGE